MKVGGQHPGRPQYQVHHCLCLRLSVGEQLVSGLVHISPGGKTPVEVHVTFIVPSGLVICSGARSLCASVKPVWVDGGDNGDVCRVDQLGDLIYTET